MSHPLMTYQEKIMELCQVALTTQIMGPGAAGGSPAAQESRAKDNSNSNSQVQEQQQRRQSQLRQLAWQPLEQQQQWQQQQHHLAMAMPNIT
jgi:hypothetical protein